MLAMKRNNRRILLRVEATFSLKSKNWPKSGLQGLKIHTHQHLAKKKEESSFLSHSIIYMGLVEYIGL